MLGATAEEFDRYHAGIAMEYATLLPTHAYRLGRREFLERLAAAPRIFLSDHFHQILDHVARANLRRAIDML